MHKIDSLYKKLWESKLKNNFIDLWIPYEFQFFKERIVIEKNIEQIFRIFVCNYNIIKTEFNNVNWLEKILHCNAIIILTHTCILKLQKILILGGIISSILLRCNFLYLEKRDSFLFHAQLF